MVDCYLGLGSNLRGPRRQLNRAIASLRTLPRSTIVKQSRVYFSRPVGVRAQPNYCNQVIAIQTTLPAHTLLRHCQAIEQKQHRIRKRHWGARTLDIDILLYDQQVIQTRDLVVPHPEMQNRDFVIVPLLEIFSSYKPPSTEGNYFSITNYLRSIKNNGSKNTRHQCQPG